MFNIKPYGVFHDTDAIVLFIRKDDNLSRIAEEAANKTGQVPLGTMHITLVRGSFVKRRRTFDMPNLISFKDDVFCVTKGDKSSCFIEATEEGSAILDTMVRQLVGESHIESNRKYHISLSNIQGAEVASVGNVWEYQKHAV